MNNILNIEIRYFFVQLLNNRIIWRKGKQIRLIKISKIIKINLHVNNNSSNKKSMLWNIGITCSYLLFLL